MIWEHGKVGLHRYSQETGDSGTMVVVDALASGSAGELTREEVEGPASGCCRRLLLTPVRERGSPGDLALDEEVFGETAGASRTFTKQLHTQLKWVVEKKKGASNRSMKRPARRTG